MFPSPRSQVALGNATLLPAKLRFALKRLVLIGLLALGGGPFSRADVTGLVTLQGDPNSRDEVFFAGACGPNESPIRHTENWKIGLQRQLADVVVWIETPKLLPVVSNPPTAPLPPPQITQQNCDYVPHVIVAHAGESIEFVNLDPTLHNILAKVYNGPDQPPGDVVFNFGQSYKGQKDQRSFDDPGIYTLQCSVHSWMTAWVRVLPPGAIGMVTGADGKFDLPASKNLTDGDYTVLAWHARFAEPLQQVAHVKNGVAVIDFSFTGAKSL